MKGISVILCCYNSEDRIAPTLQHLKEQQLNEAIQWEVVLVNNNCTDNTVKLAIEIWKDFPIPLKIVDEKIPGLIYAREKGILSSKYDHLIFCDDDNWLNADYLKITHSILEKKHNIGITGGQSIAAFEPESIIPDWFDKNKGVYAIGKQSIKTGIVNTRRYLWGAGLGIRKNIAIKCFNKKHPFLLTGRAGNKQTAGDDSELCKRTLLLGLDLYYDEKLIFKHFIPQDRLNSNYLSKTLEGFSNSFRILYLYDEAIDLVRFNNQEVIVQAIKKLDFKLILRIMYWKFNFIPAFNDDIKSIKDFITKVAKQNLLR